MNKNNEKLIDSLADRINRKLNLADHEYFYIRNTVSRFFVDKWAEFLPRIYGTDPKQLEGFDKQQYYDFIFGCKDSAYKQYFKTRKLPTREWLNKRLSNVWSIDYTIYKVARMMLDHPHLPMWWKQFRQNTEAAKEWYQKTQERIIGWNELK